MADESPRGADLTQEEFEALHGAAAKREPRELQVTVTDDCLVQVGNDLGQMYYQLTPEMATAHINHLMAARAQAYRMRQTKAGG